MYLQGQSSAALGSITHEVENMSKVVFSDSAPGVGCLSQKAQDHITLCNGSFCNKDTPFFK